MKKKILFLVLLTVTLCIGTTSCDDEDAERSLTGEWVSTDNPYDVWIVDFFDGGYGRREERVYYNNNPTDYQSNIQTFTWWADSRYVYVNFGDDSQTATWRFYFRASYLYLDGVPFVGAGAYNSKKYVPTAAKAVTQTAIP